MIDITADLSVFPGAKDAVLEFFGTSQNFLKQVAVERIVENSLAGATEGIFRLWVTLVGSDFPSSLIVKCISKDKTGSFRWASNSDLSSFFYWEREVLNYQQGQFNGLIGGVRSARCYHVASVGNKSYLYLEDVKGLSAEKFGISELSNVCNLLGKAQGNYFVRHRPISDKNSFLAEYVERRSSWFTDDQLKNYHSWLPLSDAEHECSYRLAQRLFSERLNILRALQGKSQTWCHNDFWQKNIFTESGGSIVLIDLAYSGIDAIGIDVGNLVLDSIADGFIEYKNSDELLESLIESFSNGVKECAAVDRGEILSAVYLSMALKYSWLYPAMLEWSCDKDKVSELDCQPGGAAQFFQRRCETILFFNKIATRALDLFT